jgi:hypothetical protein
VAAPNNAGLSEKQQAKNRPTGYERTISSNWGVKDVMRLPVKDVLILDTEGMRHDTNH